jgi:imidazolonepropionase-like amidohydrolase
MTHRLLRLGLLLAGFYSVLLFAGEQQEAGLTVQNFDWLTNGVKSGGLRLAINREEDTRTASFEFNDRGRGPGIQEITRFAADGQVAELHISGHSYMGAKVDEHLRHSDGQVHWSSTLEQGTSAKTGAFYLANDGTPEQSAMLARALLASHSQSLELLPNGMASISKLDEFESRTDDEKRRLSLYAIIGTGLEPEFIWLDQDRELFGMAAGSTSMVPAGWTHVIEELKGRQDAAVRQFFVAQSAPLTHHLPSEYAITNVDVVDVSSGQLLRGQSVTVSGGVIRRVAPGLATGEGMKVIDGMGGTLIPGFWDMHTHISLEQGLLHVAAGVTTVRDLGNNPDNYQAVRDSFDAGTVIGPRSFAAGIIEGKSPYSAPIRALAESKQDALDIVRDYAAMGYPQIKIYSSTQPEWVNAIIREAHGQNMRVSGHVPAFMTAERAVDEGFDEIQHINFLFLNFLAGPRDDTRTPLRFSLVAEQAGEMDLESEEVNAFIQLLARKQIVIDPTVSIYVNMFTHRSGQLSPSFEMIANRLPPSVRRGLLAGRMDVNDENEKRYKASADILLRMVHRLYLAGVPIVAGTDSMAGFGLHRELELYQKAGIPTAEILKLATLGAAELMGAAESSGSISPGKQADMVLLAENPLQDISAVRSARQVFKGGRYYMPSQMYRAVGIEPFDGGG